MMDRHETRTDQGYALWKEDPKAVAAARVQARGAIAARRLRAEAEAGLEWLVGTWPGRFAFVGFVAVCEGIAWLLVVLGVAT